MDKIDEILSTLSFGRQETILTEEDYRIVNKLFLSFQAIFPAFKQAWPTQAELDNSKREWVKAFKQAGLNDVEVIKRGLAKYRLLENPFVPSPGQFIAMCQREAKPPTDTRTKEDFLLPKLEKERRIEVGKIAIRNLLKDLTKL